MATYAFWRICMPYCLIQLRDGRYIVVNRRYKPLGVAASDHVDYDTHPSAAKLNLTAAIIQKLSWEGSADDARIYLYNDGCAPTLGKAHMDAYLARLGTLAKVTADW